MKISKKSSITLSVLLGILSLRFKNHLSSHSHLSKSHKSKLNWGALCLTCACHHLENINIKIYIIIICMSKLRRPSFYTKRTEALLPDSAAGFGQSFRVSTPQFSFNFLLMKSYHVILFLKSLQLSINFDQCSCHLGRQTFLCFFC